VSDVGIALKVSCDGGYPVMQESGNFFSFYRMAGGRASSRTADREEAIPPRGYQGSTIHHRLIDKDRRTEPESFSKEC
jgi:hypothetical protein